MSCQEELGVPYDIQKYYRNSLQQAPKELLEVNPLGKSPVVTDGDVNLAESGAIIGWFISGERRSNISRFETRISYRKVREWSVPDDN